MGRARFIVLFTLTLAACGRGTTPTPDATGDGDGFTRVDGGDADGPPGDQADAQDGPDVTALFDQCLPGVAPDDACFAQKRDPDSDNVKLAAQIALTWVAAHPAEEMEWNWEEAVVMLGIFQLYRVTGDERFSDYCRAWMDHHIDAGYTIASSDTCAPAAVAVELHRLTGEQEYMDVAQDALHYLNDVALRTGDGGISHVGELPVVSLWVDSLFMFGNVLTRYGETQDDAAALDLFGKQVEIFASHLQDPAGFFRHAFGWVVDGEPGVYWGRGNGWVAASGYDYLRARQVRGEEDAAVSAVLEKLTAAALAAQNPGTGRFWTVLNRPGESYLETSAAGLFAFGVARGYRYGLVGDEALPALANAMAGIRSQVIPGPAGGPIVIGTSGPTNPGTFADYAAVPVVEDSPYGTGAVLLALTETSGLPEMEADGPLPARPDKLALSSQFVARQKEYLDYCFESAGPDKGGLDAQVCRVARGKGDVNVAAIAAAIAFMAARKDTSDFRAAALLRLLYLDKQTNALDPAVRQQIEQALLDFKYWLSEPGEDKMCYWTENHQALYHSAELLAGQLFPDAKFTNSGLTGREHAAHARPRILRWLELRGRYGFSEWHSNVYFNEDIPALVNLVDFAQDEAIRTRAAMVLDLVAFDLLNNTYRGLFATVHGRTYENKLIPVLNDSTATATWLLAGLGDKGGPGDFSGTFLATSINYRVPAVIDAAAAAAKNGHEHRQRDGIAVALGPDRGVGYAALDDVVVWAGMAAVAAPQVINGMTKLLDAYGLWDGFLFGDLPADALALIQGMAGTPELVQLAQEMEPLSRGIALEAMSTYTWRTADYQLSGAQDYNPGFWGMQTLMWLATLDQAAYVFTSYPGGSLNEQAGDAEFGGEWIGSWLPRVTLHRNVGVIQYRTSEVPLVGDQLSEDYTHAYFPKAGFDEWQQSGNWVLGRKGTGYVALWSEHEPVFNPENDYELVALAAANVWIVELGSEAESGSFAAFVDAVTGSAVSTSSANNDSGDGPADLVHYESPSVGTVDVGWTGPMTVAGAAVDLGPYPRWSNAFASQPYGSRHTLITAGTESLLLDFDWGRRR